MNRPGPDKGLMRRASMVINQMAPQQLPLLMDAVASRAAWLPTLHGDLPLDLWGEVLLAGQGEPEGPLLREHLEKNGGTRIDMVRELLKRYDATPYHPDAEDILAYAGNTWIIHAHLSRYVLDRFAYFCGEEVTALLTTAAVDDLMTVSLSEDELPSPNGLAYLYRPGGQVRILMWECEHGYVHATLMTADEMRRWLEQDLVLISEGRTPLPTLSSVHARLSAPGSDSPPEPLGARLNRYQSPDYDGEPTDALLYLLALTHLLAQDDLIDASEEQTRRPRSDKRQKRAPRNSGKVTYLSYQRRSSTSPTVTGSQKRSYAGRWVVRGYWRRQWYATLQRHKPKWITEHIAGPDGMPIILRDRVTHVKPGKPEGPTAKTVPPADDDDVPAE